MFRESSLTLREEIAKEAALRFIFRRFIRQFCRSEFKRMRKKRDFIYVRDAERVACRVFLYIWRHMQIHLGRLQRDFPLDLTI